MARSAANFRHRTGRAFGRPFQYRRRTAQPCAGRVEIGVARAYHHGVERLPKTEAMNAWDRIVAHAVSEGSWMRKPVQQRRAAPRKRPMVRQCYHFLPSELGLDRDSDIVRTAAIAPLNCGASRRSGAAIRPGSIRLPAAASRLQAWHLTIHLRDASSGFSPKRQCCRAQPRH